MYKINLLFEILELIPNEGIILSNVLHRLAEKNKFYSEIDFFKFKLRFYRAVKNLQNCNQIILTETKNNKKIKIYTIKKTKK